MKTRLSYWAAAVVAALSIIATANAQTCGLLLEESEGYWDLRHYVTKSERWPGFNRETASYLKLRSHIRRVYQGATKIEGFAWYFSDRDNYVHYSYGLYELDQWGEDFTAPFRIESYSRNTKNGVEWKTNVVAGPFTIYGLGSDIFGSRAREYTDAHGRLVRVTEDSSYAYALSNTNNTLNCSKTFAFVSNGDKWQGMKTRQTINIGHGYTIIWTPSLCTGVLNTTYLRGVGSYCQTYDDGAEPPETGCKYGW